LIIPAAATMMKFICLKLGISFLRVRCFFVACWQHQQKQQKQQKQQQQQQGGEKKELNPTKLNLVLSEKMRRTTNVCMLRLRGANTSVLRGVNHNDRSTVKVSKVEVRTV
jgi:hypothetical protein